MGSVDALIGKGVYLDANVFVHAVEGFPEHQAFVDELFRSIDDGHVFAVTSELTLAEVLIKPLETGRDDVVAIYEQMLQSSEHLNVVPIDRAILARGPPSCRSRDQASGCHPRRDRHRDRVRRAALQRPEAPGARRDRAAGPCLICTLDGVRGAPMTGARPHRREGR